MENDETAINISVDLTRFYKPVFYRPGLYSPAFPYAMECAVPSFRAPLIRWHETR